MSDTTFKLEFYNPTQVCEIVNRELKLKVKDSVTQSDISYWRKHGVFKLDEDRKMGYYSHNELINIINASFVRLVLGVELKRVDQTVNYLKGLNILPYEQENNTNTN